jgi:hypothetical protein
MDKTIGKPGRKILEKQGVFPRTRPRNRRGKEKRLTCGRITTVPGKVSPGDPEMGPLSAKTLIGRK